MQAAELPSFDGFSEVTVACAAVVGLVLSITIQKVAHTVTMAHEGGHALFGVLMGGKLKSIKLTEGGQGETLVNGLSDRLGRIIYFAAGYLGPSIFGLLGVFFLTAGQPVMVLWATVALLALMLVFAGSLLTFAKVLSFGALVYLIARSGSPALQGFTALTWIWWLLIGAVVDALGLFTVIWSGEPSNDARSLRTHSFLPATLWWLIFMAGSTVALILGTRALLGMGN